MNRCVHGVYLSVSDSLSGLAWGCQQCFPAGHPESGSEPVLPRSNEGLNRRDKKENCKQCGNIRTYFSPNCRHCGAVFPEVELRGIVNPSNITQLGACPNCHSSVHYEVVVHGRVLKSKWQCAECDEIYNAPKRAGEDFNEEVQDSF